MKHTAHSLKIKHKIAKKSNRAEERAEDMGKMKRKMAKEDKYEKMRHKVFGIKHPKY